MSPTVEQYSFALCPASTATDVTISVSLLSTDLVLVITSAAVNTSQVVTGLGTGSQWAGQVITNDATSQKTTIQARTGVTGTGTVTVTLGGAGAASVWVVRGLSEPVIAAINLVQTDPLANGEVPMGVATFPTTNQAVIGFALPITASGTETTPSASTTPGSGWVVDHSALEAGVNQQHQAMHYLGGNGTTSVRGYTARTNNVVTVQGFSILLGEPDAAALVEQRLYAEALTQTTSSARLEREYVEAVTRGADSTARLEREYVEAVTRGATSALAMNNEYVEVVSRVGNAAHLHREYVEVITKRSPARRGWGVLL